ncbi:MAG: L,D-transpeptidase family protein [Ilumatobacteraceae bacterium]
MNNRPQNNQAARWLPAVAAAGVFGTVVIAGVAMGGGGGDSTPAPSAEVALTESTSPALTVPASVPEPTALVATTAPLDKIPLDRTLAKGLAGNDVARVQERLADLGFVPGPADGIYGDQTIKAVWAYQKLVLGEPSSSPSGQVTPEMWDAMQDPFVIQPRRPNATPNHTEVYLPEQVLAVYHDDRPVMITHMSSGTGEEWCEEVTISPGEYNNPDPDGEPLVRGECGVSLTPGGVFTYHRQVEGIRQSSLGGMWNPSYFNYGIAIHGALNVPLQPASHGCIRVPLNISENLQGIITLGDQVYVWDGEQEPEFYGAQPPRFNWLDPEYETTTTTPESTTTEPESSTTEPPGTTDPPSTTSPPPATTTTQPPATTTTTTTTEAPGGDTGGGDTGGSDTGGDSGGGDSGGADGGGDAGGDSGGADGG